MLLWSKCHKPFRVNMMILLHLVAPGQIAELISKRGDCVIGE